MHHDEQTHHLERPRTTTPIEMAPIDTDGQSIQGSWFLSRTDNNMKQN